VVAAALVRQASRAAVYRCMRWLGGMCTEHGVASGLGAAHPHARPTTPAVIARHLPVAPPPSHLSHHPLIPPWAPTSPLTNKKKREKT
jgi:hypothetical protein